MIRFTFKNLKFVPLDSLKNTMTKNKIVVYQVFTRLFGNKNTTNIPWGTIEENGVGKFEDFTTKALKEIKYHIRWSSEWVLRLGDGTPESKQRMLVAINELWRYIGEMFIAVDYEKI